MLSVVYIMYLHIIKIYVRKTYHKFESLMSFHRWLSLLLQYKVKKNNIRSIVDDVHFTILLQQFKLIVCALMKRSSLWYIHEVVALKIIIFDGLVSEHILSFIPLRVRLISINNCNIMKPKVGELEPIE